MNLSPSPTISWKTEREKQTEREGSPIIHIPKIHSQNLLVKPTSRFSIRPSLIPKIDISRTFDDYHKQKITSGTKDSDSTNFSRFHGSKSPKKSAHETQDLSSLYSLNEKDLFALALVTLQKDPMFRTDFDIKIISLSTENVKFFQEYGPQTHAECCRYMNWEHGKSHTTLFEVGSVGTKFYIILKGVVGIWVTLPKIILDENGKALEQKEYVPTEVKTLGPGSSFGELALLDNRPRAATIKCREDCEFAVLDKQHFNDILKEKEQKKLFQNIEFLSSMKLFHGFSFAALKSLYYHALEIKTLRKQVIYKKGDDPHSVYIIREGEFLMTLEIEIPNNELMMDRNGIKKDFIVKTMEMSLLGPGYIFGEEEMMEKQKRKTTVVCNSQSAVIYVLAKKEFLRRVYLEDYSRSFLKENLKIKKKFREERIKDFIETEKQFLGPKGQDLLNFGSKTESEEEKKKEVDNFESTRISQKKTLLEEMQKTFVLSEAVKAAAYDKYKAIKAKYPIKAVKSIDVQEILRKKIVNETSMTPYLKAFLKEKTDNIELKRKIEFKEERRNLSKFFQEKIKEEKKGCKSLGNLEADLITNLKIEMKAGDYSNNCNTIMALEEYKEEKRQKDPFRKLKSISLHDNKGKNLELYPLKYKIEQIIKKKKKMFTPAVKQPLRGYSF